MDTRTFATTPVMTLTTTEGDMDVFDEVAGVGGFAAALDGSITMEAFDVTFDALDLPALIAAKRAANRPKDLEHLPELEALLVLRQTETK